MEKILDSFVIIDNKTVEHPKDEYRKVIIFKNDNTSEVFKIDIFLTAHSSSVAKLFKWSNTNGFLFIAEAHPRKEYKLDPFKIAEKDFNPLIEYFGKIALEF